MWMLNADPCACPFRRLPGLSMMMHIIRSRKLLEELYGIICDVVLFVRMYVKGVTKYMKVGYVRLVVMLCTRILMKGIVMQIVAVCGFGLRPLVLCG